MLATTALWAVAFIAPLAAGHANAMELSLGRFFVYGLISVVTLKARKRPLLQTGHIRTAILFALAGNIAYYACLALGIQLSEATLAVLIIGALPVTVAWMGAYRQGFSGQKAFVAPMTGFALGIGIFGAARLTRLPDISAPFILGIAATLIALALWTWYGLANTAFLQRYRQISAADWNSMVGVAALPLSLIGLAMSAAFGWVRNPLTLELDDFLLLAFWSLVLGGGVTWLGTLFLNLAAQRLNVSVLGQLMVFEAVFGAGYVALYSGTYPSIIECFGLFIALMALWASVRTVQALTPAT